MHIADVQRASNHFKYPDIMYWTHIYNYTPLSLSLSLSLSLIYLFLLCCLYLFPKWHINLHWHYKQSMKSYYTAWWTLTHMSTLSLYNDSAAHIRVMYVSVCVCVCVCVGRRANERNCRRERGRDCGGVRISNGTRLGTFFWVLSSWVKGEDARGQPRHLSFSPSPSLSSSVGSK